MKTIEIKGKSREALGKKDTKSLRRESNVPCVVYGGEKNYHFYTEDKSFKDLIYSPNVYTVKLDIDGNLIDAILHDVQFHPVKDHILHVDFLQVSQEKPILIHVPVKLHGFAPGVQAGGKLALEHRLLKVRGLIKDLPDILDVDVSEIELGKTIKVKDLKFDNIELIDNPNTVVCSVKLTRAAKGMEEETAAAAEGEGAETAETAEK
ncbi:MAG: 50S ribosomal protein L25/general stress protein Ctc [Bacteroidetes bacterium GWF2_38_335]|nr:MAG: 50S ribosomal protein L25/general stress protein Ctc [Bacteroidetes bacterium GWF2_38_335]OFY81073.1 MAG: 50S ribosomal protein L25/general stress protein Ctc [Bacteroidetes bacterium RIFOXYA12_FULL_38_20]HBS87609.1 50S ribosomal protein L25 [Bacteroidales bacterium]